jgi:glycerol-3-phosphate responsive antiterminator
MRHPLLRVLENTPVIPAVREEAQLERCLAGPAGVVFLLCGDILSIEDLIRQVHQSGKRAVVHSDLIAGLAPREIAVDFLHRCGADGIISTRPPLIRRGRELELLTVLRVFAIDSRAIDSLRREAEMVTPDMIEILPGTLSKVIARLHRELRPPLIAGGLLDNKADVMAALGAGAMCVSASDEALWNI